MNLVEIERLEAFYGDMQALFGVDLALAAGECVALVGANGAGKSTLLKCLTGLLEVGGGDIRLAGRSLKGLPAEAVSRLGVSMSPEGRMLFASLTVEENLTMGALNKRTGPWSLARIYDLFPVLMERRTQLAPTLSGGQQQMVAIGRALMANPVVMLCDEISLGLAPIVVGQIYQSFADIRREGTAMIVVEQDIQRALAVADRVVCLLKGRITLEAKASDVSLTALTQAYFGD
jgi:branched-chain amino acid transport system ATP-binding protein